MSIPFNAAFEVAHFVRFKILIKRREDVKDDDRAILTCHLLSAQWLLVGKRARYPMRV